jgi:hypothetical protein
MISKNFETELMENKTLKELLDLLPGRYQVMVPKKHPCGCKYNHATERKLLIEKFNNSDINGKRRHNYCVSYFPDIDFRGSCLRSITVKVLKELIKIGVKIN